MVTREASENESTVLLDINDIICEDTGIYIQHNLEYLTMDIAQRGLLHPLHVRKVKGAYIVCSGMKRWAVLKQLYGQHPDKEKRMVPCIVENLAKKDGPTQIAEGNRATREPKEKERKSSVHNRRMQVVGIASQTARVGKTTTIFFLAKALAEKGKRVLLIDIDPLQGLSHFLDAKGKGADALSRCLKGKEDDMTSAIEKNVFSGIDIIRGDEGLSEVDKYHMPNISPSFLDKWKRKRDRWKKRPMTPFQCALRKLSDAYDYCLIDCASGLEASTVHAMIVSDSVILPTKGKGYDAQGVRLFLDDMKVIWKSWNPMFTVKGVVLTHQRKNVMDRLEKEELARMWGEQVAKTCIRQGDSLWGVDARKGRAGIEEDCRRLAEEFFPSF